MPSQTAPASPSPPPQAPLQQTPGPRAQKFIELYEKTLSATLNSITYDSFSSCFPTISRNADAALRGMHSGMINGLGAFAREEFEDVLRERRVVERVNGLERVVGEARRRKEEGGEGGVVAPHTLPPAPLIQSHTLPIHIAQNSQLNARLQTAQSQNAMLIEDIRAQKKEIEELLKLVEGGVNDVSKAGEALGEKVGELSESSREAVEVLGRAQYAGR